MTPLARLPGHAADRRDGLRQATARALPGKAFDVLPGIAIGMRPGRDRARAVASQRPAAGIGTGSRP